MRCLLLISALIWMLACSGPYKAMQKINADPGCVKVFRPSFTTALYNTSVNVTGKHLSGLLIIKTMPDSSIRLVFSNEAGFKFFDFEFSGAGFKVYYIYKQLNRKAIIKTLRKDFQLVLMNNLNSDGGYILKNDHNRFYCFPQGRDHYYYLTDSVCGKLIRMERGNSNKRVMSAIAENFNDGVPDTIGITHDNFNFDIGLKRIYRYAEK